MEHLISNHYLKKLRREFWMLQDHWENQKRIMNSYEKGSRKYDIERIGERKVYNELIGMERVLRAIGLCSRG